MVDGLGISGVEGPFRKCCEDTMRLLRRPNNVAALLTLAEVFIHDPLYRWVVPIEKKIDLQVQEIFCYKIQQIFRSERSVQIL